MLASSAFRNAQSACVCSSLETTIYIYSSIEISISFSSFLLWLFIPATITKPVLTKHTHALFWNAGKGLSKLKRFSQFAVIFMNEKLHHALRKLRSGAEIRVFRHFRDVTRQTEPQKCVMKSQYFHNKMHGTSKYPQVEFT